MKADQRPLVTSGTVLGVGLGGFFDGILFHQILQIHAMLTARIPKDSIARIEINMFWDGLFHAFTWLMTVLGVWLLFRAAQRGEVRFSPQTFAGSLALGWGLFNFIEGIIDHHVLRLHHVVERLGVSGYDYAFLAWGLAMIVGGWLTIRADERASDAGASSGVAPAGGRVPRR